MLFKIIICLISVLLILIITMFISKSIYRQRLKAVLLEGKTVKKMNFELVLKVLGLASILSIIIACGTTIVLTSNKDNDYIIPVVDSYNICDFDDELCQNHTKSVSRHLYQVASGDVIDDNYIVKRFEDSNVKLVIGYKQLSKDLGYDVFYYIEYKGRNLDSNEWLYLDNKTCYTNVCDNVPYRTIRFDKKRLETYYVSELPEYFNGVMKIFTVSSQQGVQDSNREYIAEIEFDFNTDEYNLDNN